MGTGIIRVIGVPTDVEQLWLLRLSGHRDIELQSGESRWYHSADVQSPVQGSDYSLSMSQEGGCYDDWYASCMQKSLVAINHTSTFSADDRVYRAMSDAAL